MHVNSKAVFTADEVNWPELEFWTHAFQLKYACPELVEHLSSVQFSSSAVNTALRHWFPQTEAAEHQKY